MRSLLGKLRGLFNLQYKHLPTTIPEQIALLRSRGMSGDEKVMERWLSTVGYYRLSAYWLPMEKPPSSNQTRSKAFLPSTDFSEVVDIYVFDRKLRLIVMEAIDRFEIAVRARWTNRLSVAHGSHAHMISENFQNGFEYAQMYSKLAQTAKQSREVFVEHYRRKYTDPYMPPLWQVTELMTLGELSKWVESTLDNKLKDEVARDLGLPNKEVMESVLQLLSYVRNICAHHSRLWNRKTVKRSPNIRQFKNDLDIEHNGKQHEPSNSIYNVLVILAKTLRHQSPDTTFPQRVSALVETRTVKQRRAMGFPDDWRNRKIWKPIEDQDSGILKFTGWIRSKFSV